MSVQCLLGSDVFVLWGDGLSRVKGVRGRRSGGGLDSGDVRMLAC